MQHTSEDEKLSEVLQNSLINPRDESNVLNKPKDYRKSTPLKEQPKNKRKHLVMKPGEVDKDKVSTCLVYDLTLDFQRMKTKDFTRPNQIGSAHIQKAKKVQSHFKKKPFYFSEIGNDCRSEQKLSPSNLQALEEIKKKLKQSTYKTHFVNLNPFEAENDEKKTVKGKCPMSYREENKEITKECLLEDLPEKTDSDIQGLVPCYPISNKKKVYSIRGFLKEQDFHFEDDYRKHKLAVNRPVTLKPNKKIVVYKNKRVLPEGYLVHAIDLGKLQKKHEYEEPPQDMGLTKWKLTEKQKLRPWTRKVNFDPELVEEFNRPHFNKVSPSQVNVFASDDDEIKRNGKVRIAIPSETDAKAD